MPRSRNSWANALHVGYVEAVEADAIRLMRADPDSAALHHRIPLVWVAGVGQTVRLDRPRDLVIASVGGA